MSTNSPTVLVESDFANLEAQIKRYPYLVYFGGSSLGPLSGAPTVSPAVETKDLVYYESNGVSCGSLITKNDVNITINSEKVDYAMTLLSGFKIGDNVFASSRSKTLLFVPITEDGTQTIITFPNAFVQPGLDYKPGESADPAVVALSFVAKPDSSGLPWYYGAAPVSSGGTVTSGGQV